jgi:hypothetical protein
LNWKILFGPSRVSVSGCYKRQGSTFEKAIVDLYDVVAGASAYVMRVTFLSGLPDARRLPQKIYIANTY